MSENTLGIIRKKFERWASDHWFLSSESALDIIDGCYQSSELQTAWEAWQAGSQEYLDSQRPECEVYKILLTGACYEWAVSATTEGFPSESEARKWAEDNGYRVAP